MAVAYTPQGLYGFIVGHWTSFIIGIPTTRATATFGAGSSTSPPNTAVWYPTYGAEQIDLLVSAVGSGTPDLVVMVAWHGNGNGAVIGNAIASDSPPTLLNAYTETVYTYGAAASSVVRAAVNDSEYSITPRAVAGSVFRRRKITFPACTRFFAVALYSDGATVGTVECFIEAEIRIGSGIQVPGV